MPTAPPRPCLRPRCPHLTPCPVHGEARSRPSSTLRRQTEPGKRLYDLQEWRRASKAHLATYPLCAACLAEGRRRFGTHVDHIVPHKGHIERFWSVENRQTLCAEHHGQKTRKEQQR